MGQMTPEEQELETSVFGKSGDDLTSEELYYLRIHYVRLGRALCGEYAKRESEQTELVTCDRCVELIPTLPVVSPPAEV